jgi:malonyl-CoA O-methyltransferase
MEVKLDKETITNNFSKHASSYDKYAGVQSEAAGMLAKMLPEDGVGHILEIGCGTGTYTEMLKDKFKSAKIKAVDISEPMVRLARKKLDDDRVSFETGDAEAMDIGSGYNLITSNAVFHWLCDLDNIIEKTRQALAPDGVLAFSIFGPNTFSELKMSLISATGQDVFIASDMFYEKVRIQNFLQKHFENVEVEERLIKEKHLSVHELLRKIKYSGTRGKSVCMRKVWSPDLLKKIECEYIKNFGSIEATYRVFFCKARR